MPVHNTASGSSIFFAKTPDFSLLCSVVCKLEKSSSSSSNTGSDPSSGIHSTPKSSQENKCGQSNILKCRELIFTESSVLASPSLQEEGNIYVITTCEFWQSGKFQERCRKMCLQVGKPIRVIPAVFQACFTYTLKAKLAPLWNKVGEYYIQGRDFITSTGILGAINLETNVTDGEICLALKPLTVKMPHCTLQDFGVCPPIITHFLMDFNYMITEHMIEDKWCYVLPSMKKGKVVDLMHQLPSSSPFKSYSDLRKYWKNNYGFRLPENGDGIVYINIFFPAIPYTIFTYPEFCIRKVDARHVPRVDSTPVLQAFLTDIKRKMPHMCHSPLEVNRKAQYTAVTMNSANGYVDSEGHSSMTLIDRKSNVPQRIPSRGLVSINESRNLHNGQPQASPYRPLSGRPTNIKSATGYAINIPQAPAPPALPPSQFGYPHNGTLSKDGRQHPQQGSSPHCPLPYGSNTKVTPSRHHHHDHQSPSQSPYTAKSTLAMPMMQDSPSQQGLYCTPPHPYASPAPNRAYHQYLTPVTGILGSGKKELPQTAPRSARNLNHTIFSLAAEPNNSPYQVSMPTYRKEGGKQVCSAGGTQGLLPPVRMQKILESSEMIQQVNEGGFSREGECYATVHAPPPAAPRPFVPIFNPKPSRSILIEDNRNHTPEGPKIRPSFTPHKPRSVTPSKFLSRAAATPTHKPETHPSVVDLTSCDDVIPPTQPKQHPQHHLPHSATLQQQQCSSSQSSSLTHHQPSARQALHFGPSKVSSFKPVGAASKANHPPPMTGASSSSHAKKRKAKDGDGSGEAKKSKPRSKPKVQENVDVQQLAQNDQLSKVNSITLVSWLKEKGVNVSSKDKKLDLISKVMTFINCTAKEM